MDSEDHRANHNEHQKWHACDASAFWFRSWLIQGIKAVNAPSLVDAVLSPESTVFISGPSSSTNPNKVATILLVQYHSRYLMLI
jgi:hypothetical protein